MVRKLREQMLQHVHGASEEMTVVCKHCRLHIEGDSGPMQLVEVCVMRAAILAALHVLGGA
jgi:hypothetical protein